MLIHSVYCTCDWCEQCNAADSPQFEEFGYKCKVCGDWHSWIGEFSEFGRTEDPEVAEEVCWPCYAALIRPDREQSEYYPDPDAY
jgi:hypothetical protein